MVLRVGAVKVEMMTERSGLGSAVAASSADVTEIECVANVVTCETRIPAAHRRTFAINDCILPCQNMLLCLIRWQHHICVGVVAAVMTCARLLHF